MPSSIVSSRSPASSSVDLGTLELLIQDAKAKLVYLEQKARELVEGLTPSVEGKEKLNTATSNGFLPTATQRQPLSKRLKPFLSAVRAANTLDEGEDPNSSARRAAKVDKDKVLATVGLTEGALKKLHECSKRFTESIAYTSAIENETVDEFISARLPFLSFTSHFPVQLYTQANQQDPDSSFTINTTLPVASRSPGATALLPLFDTPSPQADEAASASHMSRHFTTLKKDLEVLAALATEERDRLAEEEEARRKVAAEAQAADATERRSQKSSYSPSEPTNEVKVVSPSIDASHKVGTPSRANAATEGSMDSISVNGGTSPGRGSTTNANPNQIIHLAVLPPLPPMPLWLHYIQTIDERDALKALHQQLALQLDTISRDGGQHSNGVTSELVVMKGSSSFTSTKLVANGSISRELELLHTLFGEWYAAVAKAEAYVVGQYIPQLEKGKATSEARQGRLKAENEAEVEALHNTIRRLRGSCEAAEVETNGLHRSIRGINDQHRREAADSMAAKDKEIARLRSSLEASQRIAAGFEAEAKASNKKITEVTEATRHTVSSDQAVKKLLAERDELTDRLRQSDRSLQQAARDSANLREQLTILEEEGQRQRRLSISSGGALGEGSASLFASGGRPMMWPPIETSGSALPTTNALNVSQWDSVGPNVSASLNQSNYNARLRAVTGNRSTASELRSVAILLFERDNKGQHVSEMPLGDKQAEGVEELRNNNFQLLKPVSLSSLAPIPLAYARSSSAPIGSRTARAATGYTPNASATSTNNVHPQGLVDDRPRETVHSNHEHLINKRNHQRLQEEAETGGSSNVAWVSPARFDRRDRRSLTPTSGYSHHSRQNTAYMNTSTRTINDKVKNNNPNYSTSQHSAPRLSTTPRGGKGRARPTTPSASNTPNHSPVRALGQNSHSLQNYHLHRESVAGGVPSMEETVPPVPRIATPRPSQR